MTKTRIAFIMLIVLIAVMVINLGDNKKETLPEAPRPLAPTAAVHSSAPRPVYLPTPDEEQPTPDQIAFVSSQLVPAWDHIRTYYPIQNLRQEFDHFLTRMQADDVRINLQPRRFMKGGPPALATQMNGHLTVVICIPVLMDIWNEVGERETIADVVVGIMLHEQYHLDHHSYDPSTKVSYRQLVENESEAWWYSIEQCYLPMMAAGRLTHLPKDDPDLTITRGLIAYRFANGNRNHRAWREFSESVSPPPP